MLKIGLTGSIGMGKSTVAKMFAALGVPLFDADAAVHRLYARGGAAVGPVGEAFPEAVVDGALSREILARLVLGKPEAIRRLEQIVHPLVGDERRAFLTEAQARGAAMVVLEIQMLLEGLARHPERPRDQSGVDVIVVVSAPAAMQRARVLARPGMTEEKFAAILSNQLPDAEKRKLADHVIDTGTSLEETEAQVRELVTRLRRQAEGQD